MDILSQFSERLNDLMFDKENMSSKSLAIAINVNVETIRLWKNGERYICLSQLIKLADFFKCSIEFLIGRSETFEQCNSTTNVSFYDRLRYVMNKKAISRYRLVKETKIYDSYFTNWKNGADPHILTLVMLSEYLDCSIDYLIGREN